MSEKSFGARLGRGKRFKIAVGSFTDYEPQTGVNSPVELEAEIAVLEELESGVVEVNNNYREAVNERKNVFAKNDDSVTKVLSPILSYVSGKFGKNSFQYKQVQGMVGKLRGLRVGTLNIAPDAVTHSISQMGYTSITMNFKNLIVTLEGYGAAYAPTNPKITIGNLTALRVSAEEKNELVDTAYTLMVPLVDARVAA